MLQQYCRALEYFLLRPIPIDLRHETAWDLKAISAVALALELFEREKAPIRVIPSSVSWLFGAG